MKKKNKLKEQPTNKILVILGPTASGKSDLAIQLAREFEGEIISADSRQVYRGMDIGSGKVTRDSFSPRINSETKPLPKNKKIIPYWSEGIPHYLIDIVNPKTKYNAAKFKKDAEKIIKYILSRGKIPIICGGTGFWIKTIVDNISFPNVKPDWKLRNQLRDKSAAELFKKLKELDRERAKTIDPKNKVRLIRAIEICQSIGKVPPVYHISGGACYQFIQIGIDRPKEELNLKIKKRLEERFKQGMIEEVKKLHKEKKASWKRLEEFGLEYRWIARFLQEKISEKEMKENLYQAICAYAKRQRTWFKKDQRIIWLKDYSEIKKTIKNFLKEK